MKMRLKDVVVLRKDDHYSYESVELHVGDIKFSVAEALPLSLIQEEENGHKYLHYFHNRMRNAVTQQAIDHFYKE
ncbi:hypothetical protein IVIADoCa7_37 [Xanthomonas phage vB_Xar_IVIA-DoCa7]|uniref:Uncharacterized protein n=1 Tax=Xanthomonas phage vB_Xar_IVIA-DoCa7 TaxID=2975534 RepID=A0A9X9JNQ4_9CAUD|nr:hypothetical protein IVIADoCa7_37 [Xanthomonas phage vB_Xar_IVIA-DoCa7]